MPFIVGKHREDTTEHNREREGEGFHGRPRMQESLVRETRLVNLENDPQDLRVELRRIAVLLVLTECETVRSSTAAAVACRECQRPALCRGTSRARLAGRWQ